MTERRYDEQEIAAIFERAAEAQKAAQRHLSSEGLTLAELQEIGAEAGITPEFIAQAATAIGRTSRPSPRATYFGVPIGVSRSTDLPRPLSDKEWEHLVVDLRETFHAHGKVGREGSLRQWTNGNLKALVEPTPSGYRLRLETRSDDLITRLSVGTIMAVMMLFFTLVVLLKDPVSFNKLTTIGMMSLIAASVAGYAAYKAPRWARTREKQMEAIIERVTQMTSTPVAETMHAVEAKVDLDALPDQEETATRQPIGVARDRL
ncbi:MAG TPA: hypothetical protein VKP65_05310 [Rhodothermales bacterium]|nr:hypothetical protein [Rhodothermales bacterium]